MLSTVVAYIMFGMGALAMLCCCLLVVWYWRNAKGEKLRLKQTKADVADIMVLFQTMRDIIKQQKRLAREFNEEIEKKMESVKQVLARGMQKQQELFEQQQLMERGLEESRAELDSLQRQIGYLREAAASRAQEPAPAPRPAQEHRPEPEPIRPIRREPEPVYPPQTPPAPRLRANRPEPFEPPPQARDEERARYREQEKLKQTGLTDAPYEKWVGRDFDEEPELPEKARQEAAPTAPGDGQAAREAFRALLDLETEPPTPARVHGQQAQPFTGAPGALGEMGIGPGATDSERDSLRGNGGQSMAPVQKRVVEYHQAGMTVAQISRELGIGKGEVRLMLSLAQSR